MQDDKEKARLFQREYLIRDEQYQAAKRKNEVMRKEMEVMRLGMEGLQKDNIVLLRFFNTVTRVHPLAILEAIEDEDDTFTEATLKSIEEAIFDSIIDPIKEVLVKKLKLDDEIIDELMKSIKEAIHNRQEKRNCPQD